MPFINIKNRLKKFFSPVTSSLLTFFVTWNFPSIFARFCLTLGASVSSRALWHAVFYNQQDLLRLFGKYNVDLNAPYPDPDNLLKQRTGIVLFDKNRANLSKYIAEVSTYITPAIWSIFANAPTLTKVLVQSGASFILSSSIKKQLDTNLFHTLDNHVDPILHGPTATALEKVTALLDLGADVNAIAPVPVDDIVYGGMNAFWVAVINQREDRLEILTLLTERGADIDQDIGKTGTPFMYAVINRDVNLAAHLKKLGIDVNKSSNGTTALWFAQLYNDPELIELAKAKPDSDPRTIFVPFRDAESTEKLLSFVALDLFAAFCPEQAFSTQDSLAKHCRLIPFLPDGVNQIVARTVILDEMYDRINKLFFIQAPTAKTIVLKLTDKLMKMNAAELASYQHSFNAENARLQASVNKSDAAVIAKLANIIFANIMRLIRVDEKILSHEHKAAEAKLFAEEFKPAFTEALERQEKLRITSKETSIADSKRTKYELQVKQNDGHALPLFFTRSNRAVVYQRAASMLNDTTKADYDSVKQATFRKILGCA